MVESIETKKATYIRDGRAPIPLRESTSRVMSANKGKNTKPEVVFRKYIYSMGLRGYRIHKKDIPGKPDIAFTKKKVAVFINGCFWHRCPKCNLPLPTANKEFWEDKFLRNQERDKRKELELCELGWKVVTIWECEINENIFGCLERILPFIT